MSNQLTKHHVTALQKVDGGGNRLAEAIRLAGVTQRTVARALDVPESYISDLSRQRNKGILVSNAHKLSAFFGVSIEVLFPE
jgi:plasmid maintenance system antidote protein VapI